MSCSCSPLSTQICWVQKIKVNCSNVMVPFAFALLRSAYNIVHVCGISFVLRACTFLFLITFEKCIFIYYKHTERKL